MTDRRKPPRSKGPYAGLRLGGYELEELIDHGGMSSVYAAHNDAGAAFALKILDPERARDPGSVQRFQQEGRVTIKLHHDNVVHVFDCSSEDLGDLGVLHYIVMEELRGCSLKRLLDDNPKGLQQGRAVDFVRDAARGLHAAHAQNIIHRDIKPANLFVCPSSRGEFSEICKVLDFGIARVHGVVQTGEQFTFGTLCYMSPEQLDGKGVDARTDVRALGVVLYELLSGKCPFDADDEGAIRSRILHGSPPSPPPADPALGAIVLRAMARAPSARYETVADFYAALEPFAISSRAPIAVQLPPRRPAATPLTKPTYVPPADAFPTEAADRTSQHNLSLTRPRAIQKRWAVTLVASATFAILVAVASIASLRQHQLLSANSAQARGSVVPTMQAAVPSEAAPNIAPMTATTPTPVPTSSQSAPLVSPSVSVGKPDGPKRANAGRPGTAARVSPTATVAAPSNVNSTTHSAPTEPAIPPAQPTNKPLGPRAIVDPF